MKFLLYTIVVLIASFDLNGMSVGSNDTLRFKTFFIYKNGINEYSRDSSMDYMRLIHHTDRNYNFFYFIEKRDTINDSSLMTHKYFISDSVLYACYKFKDIEECVTLLKLKDKNEMDKNIVDILDNNPESVNLIKFSCSYIGDTILNNRLCYTILFRRMTTEGQLERKVCFDKIKMIPMYLSETIFKEHGKQTQFILSVY